jgi:dihydroneopterin aldolase
MRIEQSIITLNNLSFFAYHGAYLQEQRLGNTFTIDLRLHTNLTDALSTDDLSTTVSYADVFRVAQIEMQQSSQLLEHVAGRIVRQLFAQFPSIEKIEIKLRKRNPPMGADIESAGVELICLRD